MPGMEPPPTPPTDPSGAAVRTQVRDIAVDRERGVTVVFGDGETCDFGLEELRVHCPCAGCRGDRDHGRVPWPTASSPQPLAVAGAELVGAWGLSFTWNDGHSAGIYPFESLRRWCDDHHPPTTPDGGLGA